MHLRNLLAASALVFNLNLSAQTDTIMHNGIPRTYIVHKPSSFSPGDTLPLVFSIHGLVMNAQSQSALSEFNPIADRERFIVVYPNGISNSWNTFGTPYNSGVDDVGFISALIETLHQQYHIDLNRVYSCGMSNGGFMSYRLACELNDKIAAIASVTGSMTDSIEYYCTPSRPFPILHFHGTADPIVSYTGAGNIHGVEKALRYWRQYNNCPSDSVKTEFPDTEPGDQTTVTRHSWAPCDGQVEVLHYRVNNGGHTWPGNTENFLGVGGNINLDVMASEIIWEFFKQYTLPEITNSVPANDLEHEQFRIYPNPADGMLTIEIQNQDLKKITLTDISGKVVSENLSPQPHFTTLSVETCAPGMYLLNCETSEASRVFKILVR